MISENELPSIEVSAPESRPETEASPESPTVESAAESEIRIGSELRQARQDAKAIGAQAEEQAQSLSDRYDEPLTGEESAEISALSEESVAAFTELANAAGEAPGSTPEKKEVEPDWYELARQKAEEVMRRLNPDVSVTTATVDVMPMNPLKRNYSTKALKYQDASTGETWTQEIEPSKQYINDELPTIVEKGYADRQERKKMQVDAAVERLLEEIPSPNDAKDYAERTIAGMSDAESKEYASWLKEKRAEFQDNARFRDILTRRGGFDGAQIAQFNDDDLELLRKRFLENIDVGETVVEKQMTSQDKTAG